MDGGKEVSTINLIRKKIRRNFVTIAVPTVVGLMIYLDYNRTKKYKAQKLAEKNPETI